MEGPNWNLPFHIYTYASDIVIGVVLEKKEEKHYHVIYNIDERLKGAKLNYIVIEKEFLVFMHLINKLLYYIIGY